MDVFAALANDGNMKAVLLAGATFLAMYLWTIRSVHGNMPPRAFSMPVLGSFPFLGKDIRKGCLTLSKKYGDVVTVQFGGFTMVVLNSYAAVKEAFVKKGHLISGRPQDNPVIEKFTHGLGIVQAEGETWKEQRKYVHNILRDLGVGKSICEEKIKEEVTHLIQKFQADSASPIDPHRLLQMTSANIISSVTFGRRYEYSDPKFAKRLHVMDDAFSIVALLTAFPWLIWVPGDWFQIKKKLKSAEWSRSESFRLVTEHQQALHTVETPTNVTDIYLKEIEKREAEGEDSHFHVRQLHQITIDLEAAGTETVTTTMLWAINYMVQYPEIQRKVQDEIDANVDRDTKPCWGDRFKLPYTEACIQETQRLGDVTPFGSPHRTLEDVHLMGYNLPKYTTIAANLYSLHHDPNIWERPHEFYPEHFLSEDGSLLRRESFIPFSVGKRVCLGENLARMELFLLFTHLLQRFSFFPAEGEPMPRFDGVLGVTHTPYPFMVSLKARPIT